MVQHEPYATYPGCPSGGTEGKPLQHRIDRPARAKLALHQVELRRREGPELLRAKFLQRGKEGLRVPGRSPLESWKAGSWEARSIRAFRPSSLLAQLPTWAAMDPVVSGGYCVIQ